MQDQVLTSKNQSEDKMMNSESVCLDEQDLIQRMFEVIQSVSSLLSLPPDTCSILLRNFHWDVFKLQDVWFSDSSRACQSAGVLLLTTSMITQSQQQQQQQPGKRETKRHYRCPICFTCCDHASLSSATCGHRFCNSCWEQYVTIAISDGAGCLTLRCPDPDCSVSVDEALINKFASEDARVKYKRFLVNNFVECSKVIKWCPAPGCQYAIHFTGFRDQEDVTCKCSYTFCWDCVGEPHHPVDCETALKWYQKINGVFPDMQWILVHSKPCPKCKRRIEKNRGCNHMTCTRPCEHEFCWTCMGPWNNHKDDYICKEFPKQDLKYSDQEIEKGLAGITLEIYNGWLTNCPSGQKDIGSLNRFKVRIMPKLIKLYSVTYADMERSFICAWKQIIECRRVLRWTYAYGYYLPEDEDEKKRALFEDLQGQAEAALKRLHYCVEEEMKQYLYASVYSTEQVNKVGSKEQFLMYKVKVIDLTNTTKEFFNNLVKGLETGLI